MQNSDIAQEAIEVQVERLAYGTQSGLPAFQTPAQGAVGAGAPVNATYIVQTASGVLTNEQDIASLSTGFLKGTTATGVITSQSAISLTTDVSGVLPAANGGTGQSSYAVGDIPYASASTTISKLADVATGNALISGGVNTAPSYGKIGLTTHVSGTLAEGNGGTNQSTYSQGDLLYASATNTLSKLAKNTSATRYLANTGTTNNPAWDQINLANGVTGLLGLANGGTHTDLSATGGASKFLRQNSSGADITVVQPATSDLSDFVALTSFTPTIVLGSGSVTYTTQIGRYIKIGSLVIAWIQVVVNTVSTPSGTLEVAGLPFTSNANQMGAVSILASAWTAGATTEVVGRVTASDTKVRIFTYSAGALADPGANLQAGSQIHLTAIYST